MISLLCPCFNEVLALPLFFLKIREVMEGVGEPYEVVCVNDGISGRTRDAVSSLAEGSERVKDTFPHRRIPSAMIRSAKFKSSSRDKLLLSTVRV